MSRLTRTDISMAIDILSHPQWGDESDIRKAAADAIESMKELQHYKDLEEQGKLIVVQEDVLVEIYNLVHDVGPAEIAEQIRADNLNSWSNRWRASIKAKLTELKGTEE